MNRQRPRGDIVAVREQPIELTSADNFITDAVREVAGTDVGMSNGFRYAPPIPAGPTTEGDLWLLLPLDARIYTHAGRIVSR